MSPYPKNTLVSIFSLKNSSSIDKWFSMFPFTFLSWFQLYFLRYYYPFFFCHFYLLTTYSIDLLYIIQVVSVLQILYQLSVVTGMQLQGILCSVSTRWPVLGNATEQLSTFGESISFPGIFSPKENYISKQYTNDLVIVFPLGLPSLLVSTSDWLHISLFLDPFVCSAVFSFFRALLPFLYSSSFVPDVCSSHASPLFTALVAVLLGSWPLLAIPPHTVHSTLDIFLSFPLEFYFLLPPSFLAGLFSLEGNTWSHSNSTEGLAKVPNGAFCDVTFLSYLAGHGNDELGFYFRINTFCSQPLTQEYKLLC